MKKYLISIFVIISFIEISAQNQYNIWYTGSDSLTQQAPGIDFNSGIPISLANSAMDWTEGSAMICDGYGSMLFYSNGSTIWNANHDTLQNGENMGLGASLPTSAQNVIFIPFADTNYYAVIVNDGLSSGGGTGLFYSVIDRTLDSGLGGINNIKDIPLISGTDEKLAVIRHANGCDYWVISVVNNNYYAFLFTSPQDYTSTDFSCTIIDTVVTVAPGPYDPQGAVNRVKVNPKNNQVALKDDPSGSVYTLDFNNSTGVFSNPFMLQDSAGIGSHASKIINAYSYSPNGDYLYLITDSLVFIPPFHYVSKIYQFDMTVPQVTQPGSMQFLGNTVDSFFVVQGLQGAGDIQIAPDGKLYISYYDFGTGENNTFMSAINNPNTATPTVTDVAINLGGLETWHTLPNLITDYLINVPSPCSYPLTAGFSPGKGCFSTSVSFIDTSWGEPTDWDWNFGDPASGILDTSSSQNPTHNYTSAGNYTVELIVSRGCRIDTISQSILIFPVYTTNDTVYVCQGDSVLINGTFQSVPGLYNFILPTINNCDSTINTTLMQSTNILTNANLSICQGDSVLLGGAYQTISGVYNDTLLSSTGCDTIVSTTLSFNSNVIINSNLSMCQGDSVFIGGVFQNTAGIYSDTLQTVDGCDSIVSVTLNVNPSPVANFTSTPNSGLLPLTVDFTNTSIGATSYVWDFGDGNTSTLTNPSNVYLIQGNFTVMLTITDINGCSNIISFSYIEVSDLVELIIPNVFTPNGDNQNDVFTVMSVGLESADMKIFNRWGQLLNEWNTVNGFWDGRTSSGTLAPNGTYFYIYNALTLGGETKEQKGAVTLLR